MTHRGQISAFVESSPHPVWLASSNGMCTYANPALQRLTGLNSGQMEEQDWLKFVVEEDREAAKASWKLSIATQTPYRTRVRIVGIDGVPVTVDVTAFGHSTNNGDQLWLFMALYIQGPALQYPALEARLRAVLNVIPAYTWYSAPAGALTFVNERTANYLGLPEDDPLRYGIDVGAAWDVHLPLLHPDDQSSTRSVWATCLRTGTAGEARFRARAADGTYRWFLSRAEPLRSNDATLLYWIGVNLDIDDTVRTEETLALVKEKLALATQAATGAQLAAAISHEIVQPLSALVANARAALHWLEGDVKDTERAAALIGIVLRDGMSMGNVVHEVRQLFKAQSLEKTMVQPNELVQQVLLVVGKELDKENIGLSLELDPHLPEMKLDAIQVQQILLNLIRNVSGSFTPQSRMPRIVTIRTRTLNQSMIMEVEDNGGSERDPDKVFEIFYNSEYGGAGIGLAISRSIALLHGGTLVAARRYPIGIRFSLNLPVHPPQE